LLDVGYRGLFPPNPWSFPTKSVVKIGYFPPNPWSNFGFFKHIFHLCTTNLVENTMKAVKKRKNEGSVYNSNMYIQLRKSFSVIQKRIIHYVVKQLQEELYNLNDQKFTGRPIQRTLFGDCYFHIPIKAIDPLNQDTEIRKALKGLQIPIDDANVIADFMMKAERLNGGWRLLFPQESVHFLTEVSKGVTPLQTLVYLSAKSIYTIRMYELLMQFRDTGKWYKTPEEVCVLLGAPNAYSKDYNRLRIRALEPARIELEALYNAKQSDIYFTYAEERGGRGNKVNRLEFTIYWADKSTATPALAEQELQFIADNLKKIMIDNVSSKARVKANEGFINRALSKLIENNQVIRFADKLEKSVLSNHKVEYSNKGALARYILENDYAVE
jgi:hypothetical protein